MPESLRLLGLLILVIGLLLRLRPTLVVVAAAVVTGLLAGMPIYAPELVVTAGTPAPEGIINMLGRTFTENRLVSLFIITFPAIALSERFGLQERAAVMIQRVRAATVGRLQIVYQVFRVLVGALGLRLNGHASFVRPLIFPMSLGAAAGVAPTEVGRRAEARGNQGDRCSGRELRQFLRAEPLTCAARNPAGLRRPRGIGL